MRVSKAIIVLRQVLIALAVCAQAASITSAYAHAQGEDAVVICTAGGAHVVSWEDLTGAPSPFNDTGDSSAHAYCTFCLAVAREAPGDTYAASMHPQPRHQALDFPAPVQSLGFDQHAVGPPLPSRSPPTRQS